MYIGMLKVKEREKIYNSKINIIVDIIKSEKKVPQDKRNYWG